MNTNRPVSVPRWRDERGVALVLALIALVVLATLAAALLAIGASEVQIAANHLRGTHALFLAEAGLEDAFDYYRSDSSRLPTATATYSSTATKLTGLSGPGSTLTAYGSYTVQAQTIGPSTVLVIATSTAGSAEKVLRAVITNGFFSDDAIRTEGDLKTTGSKLEVKGNCGSGHTNKNYSNSGSAKPTFTQGLSATGTADSPGTGKQSKKTIPPVAASDFWAEAKRVNPSSSFEMISDGSVKDGNGTEVKAAYVAPEKGKEKTAHTYRGWTYDPDKKTWSLDKKDVSSATGATYYLQQNVDLNGGTMQATILATGDITLGGNFTLTPHLTSTLLVADKDIDMNGSASGGKDSTSQGLIAAHEQIKATGNVTITGYILAEDGAKNSKTVETNEFGGSVTITYDCDAQPPLKGPVRFISWGI